MVKVHQLVAAIATTITLSTTSAYALNMGSISWKSSYGQPLDARIELSDAKNLNASDIKPNIASSSDFSKAGLEYSSYLSNLSFSTVVNPDGTGYIKVTSAKPIKEPFVSFLVDINWPNGKASKEYTILLDIPETNAVVPTKSSTPKKSAPINNTAPKATPTQAASTYKTKRGDTLWSVAEANYGKNLTAKASKAIFDKNPKAFINGNINSLLNSYTLSMPSTQEVNAITVAQANAFLGSPTQEISANTPKQSPANAKQQQALQNQLQNSEKELKTAQLENTSLNTELTSIESEIARLEQLSKEKDEAIAIAQQAKQATKQPAKQEVTQTTNTAQPTKTEAVIEQPANAQPEKQTPVTQANEPVKAPVQTPVQVPAQELQEEPSFISSLLDNNLMLLAGGGVLLILCLAAVILRRRKTADDDAQVVDLSNITLNDEDLKNTTPPSEASTTSDNEASPLSQLGEGMGIIDKADIYLAYNHYDEAKELLKNALQEDPTNLELRLKLMEIYAEKGDIQNFEIEEQELLLLDPLAQPKIDKLKNNYPAAFNDFSFSNNPTPIIEDPFSSFNSEVKEQKADNTSQEPEIDFSDFSFTEQPTISSVKEEETKPAKIEEIEPELNQEEAKATSTKRLENQDINFELEKITPDTQNASSPLFDSAIEESFSADSPVTAFVKEEEQQLQESSDNVKFDLGFAEHSAAENKSVDYFSEINNDDSDDDIIEKDQVTTKLELVHAYIDMGDTEGAQDLLKEIIQEGNESQRNEAQSLLSSLNLNETNSDVDVTNMHHENTDNDLFNSVDHSNTTLTELELGFELPPEDEVSTKLELANAYIEMGDKQGAKDILDEVLAEGNEEQKRKAQDLLQSIN